MENLWNILGISTPVVTTIVLGAIAFFGRETFKSILQNEVSISLEDYKKAIQRELSEFVSSLKREENKELANLTGEITRATEEFKTVTGRSLDRKIRFNQKEYEGLSECWLNLRTTFEVIGKIGLEPSILPNVGGLNELQLSQYLNLLNLDETQKQAVKLSEKKDVMLYNVLNDVNSKIIKNNCDTFLNSIYKYQIFFDVDIYGDFHKLFAISENIWFKKNQLCNPLIPEEIKNNHRTYIFENSGNKIRQEMSILLEKIKSKLDG